MRKEKYETYYIPSSGQPACNVERHTSLRAAQAAYRANKGGLYDRSGGRSVIEDIETGTAITCWIEDCTGGYMANCD